MNTITLNYCMHLGVDTNKRRTSLIGQVIHWGNDATSMFHKLLNCLLHLLTKINLISIYGVKWSLFTFFFSQNILQYTLNAAREPNIVFTA